MRRATQVEVTVRQREVLEKLVRAKLTPQQLVERCRIVLRSGEDPYRPIPIITSAEHN